MTRNNPGIVTFAGFMARMTQESSLCGCSGPGMTRNDHFCGCSGPGMTRSDHFCGLLDQEGPGMTTLGRIAGQVAQTGWSKSGFRWSRGGVPGLYWATLVYPPVLPCPATLPYTSPAPVLTLYDLPAAYMHRSCVARARSEPPTAAKPAPSGGLRKGCPEWSRLPREASRGGFKRN